MAGTFPPIQTVFVIVFENHNWSSIKGSASAPYLNGTLLPQASHCEQYFTPLHPSLPNYLWLEAGTNFGVGNDSDPSVDHLSATNHLVTLLRNAGISWKAYEEDINGMYVPLTSTNAYVPRHNPFVYFDDVTGTNDPNCAYGIAHIRPFGELATDLANNTVARYNFITPNVCNDGHNSCAPFYDPVLQSDTWLAAQVPQILASAAWSNCGALFITWDEGVGTAAPIGMILLSPLARGGGYFNNLNYTHSSFVRSMQEIFGVRPWLADAANATDLSDLFTGFTIGASLATPGNCLQLTVNGVVPGKTNVVQASPDLANWTAISTNVCTTNAFTVFDAAITNFSQHFYRCVQLP